MWGCGVATVARQTPRSALLVHPSSFGSSGPRFKFGQPHTSGGCYAGDPVNLRRTLDLAIEFEIAVDHPVRRIISNRGAGALTELGQTAGKRPELAGHLLFRTHADAAARAAEFSGRPGVKCDERPPRGHRLQKTDPEALELAPL